ncbi:efflux RND transporter permease subunit [Candidatus Poribacteria bacterium]|nr:efflux RND transporter permease subunit [Candidatus Poribacteria bacterium]
MFLSNLAVNRSVLTPMMVMVLVVLGVFSYTRLSVDLYPETNFPVITVTTVYPGAGPKEIETQVSEKNRSRGHRHQQRPARGIHLPRGCVVCTD